MDQENPQRKQGAQLMVGIYYFKENLNDCLIVNISDAKIAKTTTNKEFCIAYDENEKIAIINIFSFSNHCDLENGFHEPTHKIIKVVHKITKINLKDFDCENKFVYGKIVDEAPIEGTHLHKCVVDVGKESKLNIICGAKNARKDLVTVVALGGAILPNGKRIKSGKLMNHPSEGMLCSAKELNIIVTNEGIIEIKDKVKLGSSFEKIYTEKENAIL